MADKKSGPKRTGKNKTGPGDALEAIEGGGGDAAKSGQAVEYTTLRVFAEDGEDLSELADKSNKTIAVIYRELLRPLVKKVLIERIKQRLLQLENPEGE